LPADRRVVWPRHSSLCRSRPERVLDRLTTANRADAATSITTLAAKPAGIQGFSSPCSSHHSRKNNAAEAPAAAVIKPDADGARTGPRDPEKEESRRMLDPLDE